MLAMLTVQVEAKAPVGAYCTWKEVLPPVAAIGVVGWVVTLKGAQSVPFKVT